MDRIQAHGGGGFRDVPQRDLRVAADLCGEQVTVGAYGQGPGVLRGLRPEQTRPTRIGEIPQLNGGGTRAHVGQDGDGEDAAAWQEGESLHVGLACLQRGGDRQLSARVGHKVAVQVGLLGRQI
jgi:hypothetical protein